MIMKLVLPLFMILIALNDFANAQEQQLSLKIENIPAKGQHNTTDRYFTFDRNHANIFFHTNKYNEWNNKVFGITTQKGEHRTVILWKNCDGGERACGRVEPYEKSTESDWPIPMNVTHQSQLTITNLFKEINKQTEEMYNNDKKAKVQIQALQNEKRSLQEALNNTQDLLANLPKKNEENDDLITEYIRVQVQLREENDELQKQVTDAAAELANEKVKLQNMFDVMKNLEENTRDLEHENKLLLEENISFKTEMEKNEEYMRQFNDSVEKNKSDFDNKELKRSVTLTDLSDRYHPELGRRATTKL